MKRQFCKILLAVSFLFLVPAFCMSQNLKGIWKLVQSEGSSQVVRYKVLDRNCVMNMADRQMLSFLYLTGLTERK